MTSPINNTGNNRPVNGSTESIARKQAKTGNETTASKSTPTDSVTLSEQSQQLNGLFQQIDSLPEVNQAKISAIKDAIAKGQYPLDPEKIAANLVKLEKSLTE